MTDKEASLDSDYYHVSVPPQDVDEEVEPIAE
jgi:hypothetical protein